MTRTKTPAAPPEKVVATRATTKAAAPKPAMKAVKPVKPAKAAKAENAAAAQKPGKAAGKTSGKTAAKAAKPRPQLVRDGFTMPEPDFALIAVLKARALGAARAAKKSELLRAGLHALAALDGEALAAALDRLQAVQVGRPKKGH